MENVEGVGGIENGSISEQKVENQRLKPIPYKLDELAKEPELLQKLVNGINQNSYNKIFGENRYKNFENIMVVSFLDAVAEKNNLSGNKKVREELLKLAGRDKEIIKSISYELNELAKEPELLQKLVNGMNQKGNNKKKIFGEEGYKNYENVRVDSFLDAVAEKNNLSGNKETREKLMQKANDMELEIIKKRQSITYEIDKLAKEPELLQKLVNGMNQYKNTDYIFGEDGYKNYENVKVSSFFDAVAEKNELGRHEDVREKLMEKANDMELEIIERPIPYKLDELRKEPELVKVILCNWRNNPRDLILGKKGYKGYRNIKVGSMKEGLYAETDNNLGSRKEAEKRLMELVGKEKIVLKSIPYKLDELRKEPELLQKLVNGMSQNSYDRKKIFGEDGYMNYGNVNVAYFLEVVGEKNNLGGYKEVREKLIELAIEIGLKIDDIHFLNYKLENKLRKNNDINKDIDREKIKQMIALFGEGCGADILFRYFPEYSKMDIKKAKKVIREYLGTIVKKKNDYLDPEVLKALEELLRRENELAKDVVLQRTKLQGSVWRQYKDICKVKGWEVSDHALVMESLAKLEQCVNEQEGNVDLEELEGKWREWCQQSSGIADEQSRVIWDLWLDELEEARYKQMMFHREYAEIVRQDCFDYWRRNKNKSGEPSEHLELIVDYLYGKYKKELQIVQYPEVAGLVDYVERYYRDLFAISMPMGVVKNLKQGRDFPDVVQLFNIKELSEKRRLLIADDMGLGKSASAILSREYLLAISQLMLDKRATLLIVPANMIKFGTWQKYLSEKGKGGYFEAGYSPMGNGRVLVINGTEHKNLTGEELKKYDYVIISHEKLGNGYTEMLKRVNWGMVVVDEVHQFKNLNHGKRSLELQALIDGCNELNPELYLALLSGTPIPNRVSDLAMILKLLYPARKKKKKFFTKGEINPEIKMDDNLLLPLENNKIAKLSNPELVDYIINGDLQDIRSLLLNKMQKKRLVENIEITKLLANTNEGLLAREEDDDGLMVDVIEDWNDSIEGQRYEALLEMESGSGSQKMRLLNKFLLNPNLLKFGGEEEQLNTRMKHLKGWLENAFVDKDKVVVFVNQFISGVMRDGKVVDDLAELGLCNGNDNIFNKVTPEGVELLTYHGLVGDSSRMQIQEEFKNGTGKKLLVVSGNTASVGVDFSVGEAVYFYSLPWSMADLKQQLARVYREGIEHDLEYCIPVIENTIDEAIWRHLLVKEEVIDNLINGIPLDEMQKKMAKDMERKIEISSKNLSTVNDDEVASLVMTYADAKKYLKNRYKFFKRKGNSEELLAVCHERYARSYRKLMHRSYQANASRAMGGILMKMIGEKGQDLSKLNIVDIGSGPKMLSDRVVEDLGSRVFSVDSNPYHFSKSDLESGKVKVASMLNTGLESESADYLNYCFCYHYVSSANKQALLSEANRILKIGGRVLINQIFTSNLIDKIGFAQEVAKLGFKVVEEYCRPLESRNDKGKLSYASTLVVLEKMGQVDEEVEIDSNKLSDMDINKGMELVGDSVPIDNFQFGEGDQAEILEVSKSQKDKILLKEYNRINSIIRELLVIYKSATLIPFEVLKNNSIDRFVHDGKVNLMGMILNKDFVGMSKEEMFNRVKDVVVYQEKMGSLY